MHFCLLRKNVADNYISSLSNANDKNITAHLIICFQNNSNVCSMGPEERVKEKNGKRTRSNESQHTDDLLRAFTVNRRSSIRCTAPKIVVPVEITKDSSTVIPFA